MSATATKSTVSVDPSRSTRVKIDNRHGAWVAVCSPQREELEGPIAKAAAVDYARVKFRTIGSIDQVQGPLEDDGVVKPFDPQTGDPNNAGIVGEAEYRRMVASLNLAKAGSANRGADKYVLFVRVAADVL